MKLSQTSFLAFLPFFLCLSSQIVAHRPQGGQGNERGPAPPPEAAQGEGLNRDFRLFRDADGPSETRVNTITNAPNQAAAERAISTTNGNRRGFNHGAVLPDLNMVPYNYGNGQQTVDDGDANSDFTPIPGGTHGQRVRNLAGRDLRPAQQRYRQEEALLLAHQQFEEAERRRGGRTNGASSSSQLSNGTTEEYDSNAGAASDSGEE